MQLKKRIEIVTGVLLVLAAFAGLYYWLNAAPEGDASVIAAEGRVPATVPEGEASTEVPEAVNVRDVRAGSTRAELLTERIEVESEAENEAEQVVGEVGDDEAVWSMIEQLEQLAEDPDSFHRAAFPLMAQLAEECSGLEERDSNAHAGIYSKLLGRVVEDDLRSPLVRGAVFLALAKDLAGEDFRATFDTWMRDPALPLELLRTAALAASARGQQSSCGTPLNLELLRQFAVDEDTHFPKVYPMKLKQVVDDYEAGIILEILADYHPELDRLEATQEVPTKPDRKTNALEAMFSREVLILALGHRSLSDNEIERFLLSTAGLKERSDGQPSVDIRVAFFIVSSLSNCDDQFSAFMDDAMHSSNPIIAAFSSKSQDSLVGPLSLENLAWLYTKRWSSDMMEQSLFTLDISKLGERLALHNPEDEEYRGEFTDFLSEAALDSSEDDFVRMASVNSLRLSGDWELVIATAAELFESGAPETIQGLALSALADAARADENRRSSVVEVLKSALESASSSGNVAYIKELLAEFEG